MMSKELENVYSNNLEEYISYYRRKPDEFFKEFFGIELNKTQEKFLKGTFKEYRKGKILIRPRQIDISEFELGIMALYGNNSLKYYEDGFFIIPDNKDKPAKVIFKNGR